MIQWIVFKVVVIIFPPSLGRFCRSAGNEFHFFVAQRARSDLGFVHLVAEGAGDLAIMSVVRIGFIVRRDISDSALTSAMTRQTNRVGGGALRRKWVVAPLAS